MISKEELANNYFNVYGNAPDYLYYSPGRVNLIGEHIDYHGGLVLPAALSIGTSGAISLRDDDLIYVYSDGYSITPILIDRFDLTPVKKETWTNYIRGVIKILENAGYPLEKGFNLFIQSDMPTSGGLSSSAALELLVIKMLSDLFSFKISPKEMAILGRKVENEYIGLSSGIMDQFVIANGKKDHALLLNTGSLDFDYIPIDLKEYRLVIVNSNKKRGLSDSKYNERYNETMAALKIIQTKFDVKFLANLSVKNLPKIELMLDPLSFRRVRHVITEQKRTKESASALKNGDIETFASHLIGSHMSLKEDYEVTGMELDTLVQLLLEGGALGARMTGAGFGGCAIGIIEKEKVATLKEFVTSHYKEIIGYPPTFYETTIEDGTKRI